MQPLSIPCIAMAAISFYVGANYFLFYLKWPKMREHLPFAFLCLSIGLYDVFSAGLYNSTSLQEGVIWQRFQIDTIWIIAILLIWFTSVFTGQKSNRILQFFIAWFAMIGIILLVARPELSISSTNPAIKNINLFNQFTITYFEGNIGVIPQIEITSTVVMFVYFCYLFVQHYLETRYRNLLFVLVCIILYFFGVINDVLIALEIYDFIYISEYSFSFLIIAMAYMLLDRFMSLYTDFEELNVNLERKIEERTRKISELNEDLQRIADRDGLTGIYNRRFFNEYFEIEMKRAKSFLDHKHQLGSIHSNEMNFGLALIDIDHFKNINDQYGHVVGDTVLKQVSEIMERNTFSRDVLSRYGGDEFALLLTKTSPEGIFLAMEKIRREIGEYSFSGELNLRGLKVTISVGLVNFEGVIECRSEEILKLADTRLLKAKCLGRNQIVYQDSA